MKSKKQNELDEVVDQIGSFIEYWGFRKIQGKIWAHLFLSKTPLDSKTLVEKMGVSKALVSLALPELIEYDVIQETGSGPRRTIYYQANPQYVEAIKKVLNLRERKMMAKIKQTQKNLESLSLEKKKSLNLDPDKIKELGEMVEMANTALGFLLDRDASNIDFLDLKL